VSPYRQPAVLNLASRSVINCECLYPSVSRCNHIWHRNDFEFLCCCNCFTI